LSDAYIRHVSKRIVRMFEFYSRSVNPDDPKFQTYIKWYISTKDSRSPDSVPYSELYKMVKEGIREYIHETQEIGRRPKR